MIHFVRDRLLPQDLVSVMAWNRATEFTSEHAKVADLLERFKKGHESVESKLDNAFSGLAAVYGSREIPAKLQTEIDAVFGNAAGGCESHRAAEDLSRLRAHWADGKHVCADIHGADNALCHGEEIAHAVVVGHPHPDQARAGGVNNAYVAQAMKANRIKAKYAAP
mgnify:CR=1 FL=1